MKKSSIDFLLYFSFVIISFIGFTVLIPSIFYLLNWPINTTLIISFLLTVIVFYIFIIEIPEYNFVFFLKIILSFIITFSLCCFIAGHTYDFSFDGNMYHQQAIIALAKGWNPVHNYEPETIKNNVSKFAIYHYPKAIWMSAACIVSIFKYIEYGKAVNFLFFIASLALTIHLATKMLLGIKKFKIILFSLCIVLNPIVISQLFTFYVDQEVYLSIVLLLLLSVLIYTEGHNKLFYLFYIFTGIILINIKFTSFVYGAFLISTFNLYLFVKKSIYIKNIFISSMLIVVIGTCVVGAGTFMKNTYYYGHPFYPLFGNNKKIDVMDSQVSEKFFIMNRFQKIFYSFFSTSEELLKTQGRLPVLKIPFSVRPSEVTVFAKGGGVRIGGFGPLFGGILIFSISIYLFKGKFGDYQILILFGIIFLSGALNPEAWWARLSPQFWLLPFIIIISVFYKLKNKIIQTILLAVILCNITIISIPHFIWQVSNTISLYKQIETLNHINKPLIVDFRPFWDSNKERIKHFSLKYIEADNSKCEKKVSCLRSDAKICLDNFSNAEQLMLLDIEKKDLKEFFMEKIR